MSDLVGALGLPGALVAILGAAVLALRLKKELNGGGKTPNNYGLKEASGLASEIRERLDVAERAIRENITDTRHSINNGLETAIGRIEASNDRNTEKLLEKLGQIEQALNRDRS